MVVVHHAVTAIVHDSQSLLAGVSVGIDLFLVPKEDLFGGGNADIVLLNDVEVSVEAVSFDVLAEDFHVL